MGTKAHDFVALIEQFATDYDGRPVSEVLAALLDASGYERMLRTEGSQERLDNLAELKQSIYLFETTCGEEVTLPYYLAHVALFTNADLDDAEDKVKLMTIHAAKGLEFPYVFLCGMNDGIFSVAPCAHCAGDGRGATTGFCGADACGEGALSLRSRRTKF